MVDLKLDGLEEPLVLGHAEHEVHVVVLAPVHQLGGDVGEEVPVDDPGAPEDLLDAERLLGAPVDRGLKVLGVDGLEAGQLALRAEVGAVEGGGQEGGEPHLINKRRVLIVCIDQSEVKSIYSIDQSEYFHLPRPPLSATTRTG